MASKKEKTLLDTVLDSVKTQEEEASLQDVVLEPFESLIDVINDKGVKSLVRSVLFRLYKYRAPASSAFWESPAAMQEGRHPPDEYDKDGLVLHTKRVAKTALCMAAAAGIQPKELDILIAAALLHDITKAVYANEEMEVSHDSYHMYTIDSLIEFMRTDDQDNAKSFQDNSLDIEFEDLIKVLRLVRCSHGVLSPIPETLPVTESERILAMADYVASNFHLILPEVFGIEEEDDDS